LIAFKHTYVSAVTTAISQIANPDQSVSFLLLYLAANPDNAFAVAIWSDVLAKQGQAAVPLVCKQIAKTESPRMSRIFLFALRMIIARDGLGKNRQQAIQTLQAAALQRDETVKELAKKTLSDITNTK